MSTMTTCQELSTPDILLPNGWDTSKQQQESRKFPKARQIVIAKQCLEEGFVGSGLTVFKSKKKELKREVKIPCGFVGRKLLIKRKLCLVPLPQRSPLAADAPSLALPQSLSGRFLQRTIHTTDIRMIAKVSQHIAYFTQSFLLKEHACNKRCSAFNIEQCIAGADWM